MAWLKIDTCTPDKPEIFAIAAALNISPDEAFGICFRLWRWFDAHTENGNAVSVTLALLDRHLGVTGFGHAALAAGWLVECEVDKRPSICLPNFDRHNGETAKRRALTAKRVAGHKAETNAKGNAKGNARSVSGALPREEKIREEKIREVIPPTPKVEDSEPMPEVPDSIRAAWTQWLAYKSERKEAYKPTGLRAAITHLRGRVTQIGAAAVRDKINKAMASGWKGWDFEDKANGHRQQLESINGIGDA